MKRIVLFSIYILYLSCYGIPAQDNSVYTIDYKDPSSVVNAIFYAAKSRNYSILSGLCDPQGKNDKDTRWICSIYYKSTQMEPMEVAETNIEMIKQFVRLFEKGFINGKISFEKDEEGNELSLVPIWINHPGGESRSNETMVLIKRESRWYLFSM